MTIENIQKAVAINKVDHIEQYHSKHHKASMQKNEERRKKASERVQKRLEERRAGNQETKTADKTRSTNVQPST